MIDLLIDNSCSIRENMCSNSKKRNKSCFLDLKNVKTYVGLQFHRLLNYSAFNYSIAGKSRSPTSNILLRSVDTRNYATENCV